ncbi:9597_t:CDS:2, partial [Funneliformis geosporum]
QTSEAKIKRKSREKENDDECEKHEERATRLAKKREQMRLQRQRQ